jgi:hypothetical protein
MTAIQHGLSASRSKESLARFDQPLGPAQSGWRSLT